MKRSEKLTALLAGTKKTADQVHAAYTRAEALLTAIEDREARETGRGAVQANAIRERFPAVGGGR